MITCVLWVAHVLLMTLFENIKQKLYMNDNDVFEIHKIDCVCRTLALKKLITQTVNQEVMGFMFVMGSFI